MQRLAVLFAFACASLAALPAAAAADAPSRCPGADLLPIAANIGAVESATVCLVNAERVSRGLPRLHRNRKLKAAALAHSEDMVRRHYFSHDTPSGAGPDERIGRAGYMPKDGPWVIGENLAWATETLPTPRQIVRAWMKSPEHRRNILFADFHDVGIGVVLGVPDPALGAGATYSAEFGAKGVLLERARRARRARANRLDRPKSAALRGCRPTASPAVSFCPA